MNIGTDIRVLARGARTGVEEYTINLLSHLLPLDQGINHHLFYNAWQKAELDYPWLNLANVKLNNFRIPNRFFFVSARYFARPKIDKLLGGLDVYFNPHFFAAPVSPRCRKVTTFHDLSFIHFPEFFSLRKRLWQRFLMDAGKEARQADKIIAVSQSTKDDLINFYGVKPEKIKVVYSGAGRQFKPGVNGRRTAKVMKKYGLPDEFILYFGTIEPRKNIAGLIRAFESVRRKHPVKLVIAGEKGWLYRDIFRKAKESPYQNDIVFTGFIKEQDKPDLYRLAKLFVYPSFFEGFGFPPLEAMACGTPTVVSNNSSLPEVVGDGAVMANPKNIDELAWAMETVLTDTILREQLIGKGREQAGKFSWRKCARETLTILRE